MPDETVVPGHPPVTVVMVTYNSAGVLPESLAAIARHLPDARVVVVDNGSSDDSVDIARRDARVRVLSGHGNVGFGAGVNIGVEAATTDLILVVNPDATIDACDPLLLRALADDRRPLGIRGGIMRSGAHETRGVESAWPWPLELAWALLQWFVLPRTIGLRRPRSPAGRGPRWVSGVAFVVRRGEFRELGGFDRRYFLYFEDQDLSRRYLLAGLPVTSTRGLVVNHKGQDSSPGGSQRPQALGLLSLVELAAVRSGTAAGRRAARAVDRGLRCITLMASVASRLPGTSRHGKARVHRVADIRRYIAEYIEVPPTPCSYPMARAALRDRFLPDEQPGSAR